MKTSSAKAKGRRAAQELCDALLAAFPELEVGDIGVVASGVTGPDLFLSPKAKKLLPLVFECKNQESIQIWAALAQASSHAAVSEIPILAFRRNRTEMHVALKLSDFLKVIRGFTDSNTHKAA